ncbi:hypothetical protein HMI55_003733, partial [Coelomomyces lativittatus]
FVFLACISQALPSNTENIVNHQDNVPEQSNELLCKFKYNLNGKKKYFLARDHCHLRQIFLGFVAATLDYRGHDEYFKFLVKRDRLRYINNKITSLFNSSSKEKKFIQTYFGEDGEDLLREEILNFFSINIQRSVQETLDFYLLPKLLLLSRYNSVTNKCDEKSLTLPKSISRKFDFLLVFHSLEYIEPTKREKLWNTNYEICKKGNDLLDCLSEHYNQFSILKTHDWVQKEFKLIDYFEDFKDSIIFHLKDQYETLKINDRCRLMPMVKSFVAAVLVNLVKQQTFNELAIQNQLQVLNNQMSLKFDVLQKKNDFIQSYLGKNGEKILSSLILKFITKHGSEKIQQAINSELLPDISMEYENYVEKKECVKERVISIGRPMTSYDYLVINSLLYIDQI